MAPVIVDLRKPAEWANLMAFYSFSPRKSVGLTWMQIPLGEWFLGFTEVVYTSVPETILNETARDLPSFFRRDFVRFFGGQSFPPKKFRESRLFLPWVSQHVETSKSPGSKLPKVTTPWRRAGSSLGEYTTHPVLDVSILPGKGAYNPPRNLTWIPKVTIFQRRYPKPSLVSMLDFQGVYFCLNITFEPIFDPNG